MDARNRKRYEVLVALSLGEPFVADEMCGCQSLPINYWLHPDGTWSKHPVDGDGEADAIQYIANRCVGWIISCPRCHRNFAAALKVPSVTR